MASYAGRSTNKVSELDTEGIRLNNYASQSSIGGSIPVLLKEHQGKEAPQSSSLQALSTMKEKKNNFVDDYKQWSSFKYPKNLSKFFIEQPLLKSKYLLTKLDTEGIRSTNKISEVVNLRNESTKDLAIKDLAFEVCYSQKFKQQQNKTRIRGRCIQTNRPRSVSRLLRLSRIRIRTLALEGKITGCTRSTW